MFAPYENVRNSYETIYFSRFKLKQNDDPLSNELDFHILCLWKQKFREYPEALNSNILKCRNMQIPLEKHFHPLNKDEIVYKNINAFASPFF